MTETSFAGLPGRGIKPLVSLRTHARLALIIFVLGVLLGIPAVFIKGEVFYAATAVVQVAPRYMKNLRDDGELDFPSNTQYREFLEQQTRSVNRYDIVRDALASLGDRARSWRKPGDSERKSVDALRGALVVRTVPDTYMIEIQLQSRDKEGLAEVVNAVVSTYVERMRTERVFGADVRIRTLEARELEIAAAIQENTDKRTALALQLGIGAFSGKEENPYDRVLADLRSAHADARNKRFEAESQLKAFENHGETDIKTRSVQEAVLIDPGLSNLKANLFKRRADLLTQLSGLQPAHPIYAEVTAELKRIDTEISGQTSKLRDQVAKSVYSRYQTSVDQSRRVESNLKSELDEMARKGAGFAGLYNQAMTLTYDIDQQRKELDTVRERLNHFAAEQNSFGFVRLVVPALPPEMPYGAGKKKLLLMLLVGALLLALAAPVVIDLMDRRIQTVNDAEKILGIPALGWMVDRTDSATQLFGEDLLRRLAGGLINERNKQGTQVFAFSSVKPGGGSSELALELAKTLDALGYRTLAVEANAFRQDARYAGDGPGLAECLKGEASPEACIRGATDSLPARVGIGAIGRNNHLDRLDRAAQVTEAWAREFSFVLVDLPPLLLSADAEILARNLQHLVVVIEANGINAGELRRAGRHLEKLDPAALGMIINRVKPFDGGGYLQGAILEYLSARKLQDYFTTSSWMLGLQARLISLQTRHPRMGAVAEKIIAGVARMASPGTRPARAATAAADKTGAPLARRMAGAVSGSRKAWVAAAIIATMAAAGYYLAKHPAVWMSVISEAVGSESPAYAEIKASAAADGAAKGQGPATPAGRRLDLKFASELSLPDTRKHR